MSPRLTALLLLAAAAFLAAPAAHAVAANTTLNINVTVTVTSVVRIEWDAAATNSDGTTPAVTADAVYAAGTVGAGSAAVDTVGAADPDFIVLNAGTARVDMTAQVTASSGLTYTTGAPTLDNFRISAANDGATFVVVPKTPTAAVSIKTDLTITSTVTIDLQIEVPPSISAASTATTATVALVAAAG